VRGGRAGRRSHHRGRPAPAGPVVGRGRKLTHGRTGGVSPRWQATHRGLTPPVRLYSTSKMHSISTAMPPGRVWAETALRAPPPASPPNTSFISSENPLITFGWSVNSAVQLTHPSVLTSRLTLSSDPSTSRTVARIASPTGRAAPLPWASV